MLNFAHQIAVQTRQHMIEAFGQFAAATITIAQRLQNDVNTRFLQAARLIRLITTFAHRQLGSNTDSAIDTPPSAALTANVQFQGDLGLTDINDFGAVIGNESAQFVDRQIAGNRRDDIELASAC